MRTDRIRMGGGVRTALLVVPLLAGVLSLAGCMSTSGRKLTEGMVKMHIEKGWTTKAEVLEAFGPPEFITHNGDLQLWIYERTIQEREFTGGYVNVLVAGSRTTRERSASSTTLLYLYFDDDDTVVDYRLHKAPF
jgi:outer membrane protein assembly factor BamE (lipoprotein component of BamABCDE complex)